MKAKPTKAQVNARVQEILCIRLDGAEIWDIRGYVREKEQEDGSPWKLAEGEKPLSDSQLYRYLARAEKLIAESCRASRKKLLRRHLAQRRNIVSKALSAGDYRAALAALRDEAELLALYPPKRTELTGKDGAPLPGPVPTVELTEHERDACVNAILARLGEAGPRPALEGPGHGA